MNLRVCVPSRMVKAPGRQARSAVVDRAVEPDRHGARRHHRGERHHRSLDDEAARHGEAVLVEDLDRTVADRVRIGVRVEGEDHLLEQRCLRGRRVDRLRVHVGGVGELDGEERPVRVEAAAARTTAATAAARERQERERSTDREGGAAETEDGERD